jgi:hypothetical protein
MEKTKTDNTEHVNLSGFFHFLRRQYRFSEHRIRGIIACTGMILNKVHDLTMSRADLERIRSYIKGIGLTGETINFYMTSFILYVIYMESVGSGGKNQA